MIKNNINLKLATKIDLEVVVEIDELKRIMQWEEAIEKNNCYLILSGEEVIGFTVFNYSFFGHGWLSIIEIKESFRKQGIGEKAVSLIIKMCKTEKLFTSTNQSNGPMRSLLIKMSFTHSGTLDGLDENDPEMFYYKQKG
ncbi:MAG: GNAT family N-acetyltransferase [Firmicutes bacterium]|nr:GNAT family N-acetyltransferase [Bacillota bacterium]